MFVKNLYKEVLLKPIVNSKANQLLIISGYASSAMAFRHMTDALALNPYFKVRLLIGMAPIDGIDESNHRGFMKLMENDFRNNFECSYVYKKPPVHSKVYIWAKDDKVINTYIGSANYSQTAFFGKTREVLAPCLPNIALDYFEEIEGDTIYCNHNEVEEYILIYSKGYQERVKTNVADTNKITNSVTISFLDNKGNLPQRSGLNWGQRPEYRREPNQAYIRVPKKVSDTGFFPPKGEHFFILTDDGHSIICTRAQAEWGKAIESPQNNSLIGEYFRNRLGVSNGAPIYKEHLIRHGRTDVTFVKIDNETYYMDFSTTNE